VDSREFWQERIAEANRTVSKLLYEVLSDDDHAQGCKQQVNECRIPGCMANHAHVTLCGKPTFFRLLDTASEGAKGTEGVGTELCVPHATARGDKCDVDECPYEGNYLHKDVPWDYECNAPACDPEGFNMCYHHAHEDLSGPDID
jgi:hypothetical protein